MNDEQGGLAHGPLKERFLGAQPRIFIILFCFYSFLLCFVIFLVINVCFLSITGSELMVGALEEVL